MAKSKKEIARLSRGRNRSKGTARFHPERPRLCVYRSNRHIEAQIIDDFSGQTLVSASSLDKELKAGVSQTSTKVESSSLVGKELAKRAKSKKIDKVVLDRNGFTYHGRVKALADAAREGGLSF
jgi:large subunit ribosomal protein L18